MFTAVQTLTSAAATLVVQVFALVALEPLEFGSFSIQYLLYAFGASLALSLISEPWLRRDLALGLRTPWPDYAAVSFVLAGAMAAATLLFSVIVEPLRDIAVAGSIAVGASVYRTSARYHAVRSSARRSAIAGDTAAFVVVVLGWVGAAASGSVDLAAVAWIWAGASLAAAAFSTLPGPVGRGVVGRWRAAHRRHIAPLLRDSLLMDAGSIGTPFALAPILGLQAFGVYRAVSNTAAPVRLILTPVRPLIAARSIRAQRRPGSVAVVVVASIAMGALAFAALAIIDLAGWDLGSLSALSPFALPTAVFVAANLLGSYYYIAARGNTGGARLLVGRILQTLLAVACPLAGVLLAGLEGAIWGYAGGTAVSAVVWFALLITVPDPRA